MILEAKEKLIMNTVKEATIARTQIQTSAIPWASAFAVTLAILVGVLIIASVGFAGPEAIHNAAHDIRHGLVFPCH